jgi:flagellar M-ring protein FliF
LGKTIKEIFTNFGEFFKTLDTFKKIGVIGIIVGIITGLFSIIIWASKTQYSTLYTNLNKEDSANVSRILKEGNIPFLVEDDGKTVKIPEEKVDILRLEIAKRGVSFTTTVGYEVFDNQSFGTSSFVQKINKQRALEGELIKTIKHIKGVRRARVHLSIPESSPFVSNKKPPGASVVLELEPGFKMNPEEIKGITQLVSASVDEMRPEHVVVIDSNGKKLSENVLDPMTSETASRMALESKMNRQYENQIEEILSKVVGAGKVIAKVQVKLDYTQKSETQTQYDNENTAVISEVRNTQKLEGARPSPQGIPGARSNLPGEAPQPGIPETRNNVDKSLVTRNFNVPSKIIKSKKPTADIKILTAAVMVDGKRSPIKDEAGNVQLDSVGFPKMDYQPWSQEEIENFQAIVASSIGLDTARGDKIVIRNMEFVQEDLSTAEAILRRKQKRDLIKNIIKYLIVGSIIALFFFVVVKPFIQWITDNSMESIEDFLPKTIEELESVQANQKLPGLEDALPSIEEKLNPEKIEGNMLKEKVINLIEANPAKAAQVVYNMMHYVADDQKLG